MRQLPEFFQEALRTGADTTLHSISYDDASKSFLVAGLPVPLCDFEPYHFDPFSIGLDDKGIPAEEIGQHPLYLPIMPGRLIVSPSLHDWAEANASKVAQTWRVIQDAYSYLTNFEIESAINVEASTTHIGFAAGLREYGGIYLQTMGNCACMGPVVDSVYINGQFENGYGEYDMYNADVTPQRASLFAGMGHLATLAALGE